MKVDIYNTNKKYNIIYADPPWSFKTYSKKGQNKATGAVTAQYNTMNLEELKNLGEYIKRISADECILFMWVTFPTIEQAFKVIKAWGFTYKTCAFCWVKQNPKNDNIYSGIGHWTNANAELVLLATKKKFPKRKAKNVKQIVLAHREKHSKKPDEVRDRIVELVGELPRIELFAREEVEGWDCWRERGVKMREIRKRCYMKVPGYIKEAIIKTAKANYVAYKNSEIVRNWLEKRGLENTSIIDKFIDCCEYGNNIPEDFIKELEKLED